MAVVFDVPLERCLARNAGRPGRQVPDAVVRRHVGQVPGARRALADEGFATIHVIGAPDVAAPLGWAMPNALLVRAVVSDSPYVRFSQHTLANGLRVIVAPDRVAPVVAINLWYDVGSKHEQPGKTGFAHLFEHFMFQGSRHVAKAEHLGIVQGAGGVCNATTYFDRTNYFETLPSHQVELGLWLEADRMATLLDALSQENLDNQRDVVKNEKRQSYDNRPYGSFYEKLMAAVFPPGHPYHHTPIGSMDGPRRGQPGRRAGLLPHLVRAQQRGPHGGRRRRRAARHRDGGALLRSHRAQPGPAGLALPRPGSRCSEAARSCPTRCRSSASTWATAVPPSARAPSTRWRWPPRSWPAAAAAGFTGAWCGTSRWPRTWPSSACRWWPARRSRPAG